MFGAPLHRIRSALGWGSAARRIAPRHSDILAALERIARQPHAPSVIVPIYNAAPEVADCIASLIRHTPQARVILIDDASTDPAVEQVLDPVRAKPGFEVYRNNRNLGFTRTVNRGLELAGRSDAVLLNSDTKVTPRWLDNLRLAAYSADRTGTATPFSNNAGAFSAPEPNRDNPIPPELQLDAYARLVTRASSRSYPRVPTGSGFCMYVRRDCLDEVGNLDAEAFPRGYGEENDFCMRASGLGWEHVIDDATLIYHVRSASFGEEKLKLISQGRAVLDARYPDYSARVGVFMTDPVLQQARGNVAAALVQRADLFDSLGPTHLSVGETGPATSDRSVRVLLIQSQDGEIQLLERKPGSQPVARFRPDPSGPGPEKQIEANVAGWLASHAVERVRVAEHSALSEMVCRLCARLNIPNAP